MSGSPHRIDRWLRLALACLALVGGSAAARALPNPDVVVVAVSADRRGPPVERAAVAPFLQRWSAPVASARVQARLSPRGRGHEVRVPGPPRRLFLAHRALLR
jgi:hypothetical protein